MTIDPQEESERVRKALKNVEDWQRKYIGDAGFSGGVRMTVETQDGVKASRVTRYGDLAASEKIMRPEMTRPTPKVETVILPPPPDVPPSEVIAKPLPWWRRLLNHLLAEKKK
jgi:hypothetical protein